MNFISYFFMKFCNNMRLYSGKHAHDNLFFRNLIIFYFVDKHITLLMTMIFFSFFSNLNIIPGHRLQINETGLPVFTSNGSVSIYETETRKCIVSTDCASNGLLCFCLHSTIRK